MSKSKITRRRWTVEEKKFIAANQDNYTNEEFGYLLDRTPFSIYSMRGRMGIDRGNHPFSTASAPKRAHKAPKVAVTKSFLWGLFKVTKSPTS